MTKPDNPLEDLPVEKLHLSMQALGYLKRTQIYSLADLMLYTQEDLITLNPEYGKEVITALEQHFGLTLPTDEGE